MAYDTKLAQAERLLEETVRYLEHFHNGIPDNGCAGCQLKQKLDAYFSPHGVPALAGSAPPITDH